MPIFTWSDQYSIHIDSIDEQHQKLFALTNQLYDAIQKGSAEGMIAQTLDGLIDYASDHFSFEEKIFAEANYPGLAAHQDAHGYFIQKIFEVQYQQRAGRNALSEQVFEFLKTWLIEHILSEDKKFAIFMSSQGKV